MDGLPKGVVVGTDHNQLAIIWTKVGNYISIRLAIHFEKLIIHLPACRLQLSLDIGGGFKRVGIVASREKGLRQYPHVRRQVRRIYYRTLSQPRLDEGLGDLVPGPHA
jgi:hypothetical protein